MWVRIAAHYPVFYETEPLATYRLRSASNSGRSIRTGENMCDVRKGLEIVQSYLPNHLPQATVSKLLEENREYSAVCALETASRMFNVGDTEAGVAQIREALRCSHSLKIVKKAGHTLLRAKLRQIKQVTKSLYSV